MKFLVSVFLSSLAKATNTPLKEAGTRHSPSISICTSSHSSRLVGATEQSRHSASRVVAQTQDCQCDFRQGERGVGDEIAALPAWLKFLFEVEERLTVLHPVGTLLCEDDKTAL